MNYKSYCRNTLRSYYMKGLISFDNVRFDFTMLQNDFDRSYQKITRMNINNDIVMIHVSRSDVVLFKRGGDTDYYGINLNQFKSYLGGIQCPKYRKQLTKDVRPNLVYIVHQRSDGTNTIASVHTSKELAVEWIHTNFESVKISKYPDDYYFGHPHGNQSELFSFSISEHELDTKL